MRPFTFPEQLSLAWQFATKYSTVEKFPRQSQADIRAYQLQRVQKLVTHAYTNTDFYRRKYDAAGIRPEDIRTWVDFHHLPTVSKDDLIEYAFDMIDRRRKADKLIVSRSSGSSGKFVNLYYDAQFFIEQELQVIRMLKEFYPGYKATDRELLIYTSSYPFSSIMGFYSVDYVYNLLDTEAIWEAMKKIKPAIVAVYPSILREIINVYGAECKTLGIKAIITNSEQSSQIERDRFAAVFCCGVFDEYSSEEVSGIAYQCAHKNYHLVQDAAYIELLDAHGTPVPADQRGEIVGTSLMGYAMPIIRYRQGDYGVMCSQNCTCGKHSPIFDEIEGRKNASFRRTDETQIPSGRILDWTYSLVLSLQLDILEFQVTQHTLTRVDVTVVPGANYDVLRDSPRIEASFRETFGSEFEVTVNLVHEISKTESGKHIPIRSFV